MNNPHLLRANTIPRVTAQISTDIWGYEEPNLFTVFTGEPKKYLKTKTCCPIRGCGCEQPINNFYVNPYAEDESDDRRHLCKICWDIQNKPKNGWVRWKDIRLIEHGHDAYSVLFFDEEEFEKLKEQQAKELAEAHRRLDAYKKEYNSLKLRIAA
tara:strand:- start:5882 stop:6346 length:465 start_codon:yes stop_codon:yes gene_type:complete